MHRIKEHYRVVKGGEREFADLLLPPKNHGNDMRQTTCERAVDENILRLPAIIDLIKEYT